MKPWESKAHKIIARYARTSWEQNKRRGGYSIPPIAVALVDVLGWQDRKQAEYEIKRLFLIESTGSWSLI